MSSCRDLGGKSILASPPCEDQHQLVQGSEVLWLLLSDCLTSHSTCHPLKEVLVKVVPVQQQKNLDFWRRMRMRQNLHLALLWRASQPNMKFPLLLVLDKWYLCMTKMFRFTFRVLRSTSQASYGREPVPGEQCRVSLRGCLMWCIWSWKGRSTKYRAFKATCLLHGVGFCGRWGCYLDLFVVPCSFPLPVSVVKLSHDPLPPVAHSWSWEKQTMDTAWSIPCSPLFHDHLAGESIIWLYAIAPCCLIKKSIL